MSTALNVGGAATVPSTRGWSAIGHSTAGGWKSSTLAGYPVVVWLLLGGSTLLRSVGFAYPFLAFQVAGRGHQAAAVGAVLAVFGLGWVFGQLACGWLVDRVGGRSTLVATMLLAAVVLVVMSGASTMPTLLVGAALTGLVYDAPRPVLGATIAELVPDPPRRARVDAWRYGWMNIAAGIAGGAGGMIAGWAGVPLLYWINGVACAVFALVAAYCIPAAACTQESASNSGYRQAFADERLVLLFASSLATLTAFMAWFAAMPMLISDSGLGTSTYGWAQLANAVAVLALTPLITPWVATKVEHGPRVDILAAAAAWTALCMGAVALVHTTVGYLSVAVASAPAEIIWFAVGAGIVHRIAPPRQAGSYHGLWSMAVALGAVIAPILSSQSLIYGGRLLVAATITLVGLFGAALCWPLAPRVAQRSRRGALK